MASPERKQYYTNKYNYVIDRLKDRGREVSFGNRAVGLNPADPPGDYRELGKVHAYPIKWDQNFSNDVQADDLFFVTTAETDLMQCRVMVEPSGQEYNVMECKPMMPDDMVILFEVQVRGNG